MSDAERKWNPTAIEERARLCFQEFVDDDDDSDGMIDRFVAHAMGWIIREQLSLIEDHKGESVGGEIQRLSCSAVVFRLASDYLSDALISTISQQPKAK